jgi:ElaB/YqjD/DUF883 family membrane-anchored ribosome-binding protein
MDHEAEVIKQQMEQTRSALVEKLETLEEQVASTVRSTTEAVSDTVEAVKGAVEGTVHSVENSVEAVKETFSESVESVKETFNLSRQVEQRPWMMMGGGVVVGYLAGCLLQGASHKASAAVSHWSPSSVAPPPTASPSTATSSSSPHESYGNERGWFSSASSSFAPSESAAAPAAPASPSTWDRLSETLGPTAEKVKGMAIGAAAGLIGNLILQSVPQNLRGEVEQVINEFTTAMGGKPMPDFLHGNWSQSRSPGGSARP